MIITLWRLVYLPFSWVFLFNSSMRLFSPSTYRKSPSIISSSPWGMMTFPSRERAAISISGSTSRTSGMVRPTSAGNLLVGNSVSATLPLVKIPLLRVYFSARYLYISTVMAMSGLTIESMPIESLMKSNWFMCSGSLTLAMTCLHPSFFAKDAITMLVSSSSVAASKYSKLLMPILFSTLIWRASSFIVITSSCCDNFWRTASFLSIIVIE